MGIERERERETKSSASVDRVMYFQMNLFYQQLELKKTLNLIMANLLNMISDNRLSRQSSYLTLSQKANKCVSPPDLKL